jgi:hypothetical protein
MVIGDDEVEPGIATAYGATARIEYIGGYPVAVNHARESDFAVCRERDRGSGVCIAAVGLVGHPSQDYGACMGSMPSSWPSRAVGILMAGMPCR